jgi:ABC-type Mn2+/Zn2+ transport system permease subunit
LIQEFLSSWDLFKYSYLEGWLIGLLLSLIGVLVVARDQIFIGAAVSEASTVGIALALLIGSMVGPVGAGDAHSSGESWIQSDTFQSSMAVVFSIMAALVTTRGEKARRESHEAVTGWVFLISASLSVLLVSHSPHGLEEIHRLHSSSLIGATELDVKTFAVFAALTAAGVLVTHRRLLLLAMDPAMAAAVGMRVTAWSMSLSVWLGLAIGLSIRASGMLYTFGMLVLPALVAKNLCREVRIMFLVSPAVAVIVSLIGFVLANHKEYDYPPAQMTVALLGALLVAVWVWNRLRR